MTNEEIFLKNFEHFNSENLLLDKDDKVLVAISGGPDSVALLKVLKTLHYKIEAAHVNYQLREEESFEDELFVLNFCESNNIPIKIIRFDTEKIATQEKTGIQNIARILRYNWFEEICNKESFNKIVTAHHMDDHLESILLNISRGTGINGLKGIHIKQGKIVRPFLFTNKNEILAYLKNTNTEYRNDSSNNKNKYKRNFLRNEIVPNFKELNNQVLEHVYELSSWAGFYQESLDRNKKNRTRMGLIKPQVFIPIKEILDSSYPINFIQNETDKFGFTKSQIKDILSKIKAAKKGQYYLSNSHQLVIDINHLVIDELYEEFETIDINKIPFEYRINGLSIQIKEVKKLPNKIKENELYFTADKLDFPIQISKINPGDRISQLGLKGTQKVSDYLINKKVNKLDKKLCYILKNNNETVALIPLIIDKHYAVKKSTKKIFKITYK
jgi:tRNA(Ile)-lysidine synthase